MPALRPLLAALLLAHLQQAAATPPPRPPPCPDIGADSASVTSLLHAMTDAGDQHVRECAVSALAARGKPAMNAWVALLGSGAPDLRATGWWQVYREQGSDAYGGGSRTLAHLGFPSSALASLLPAPAAGASPPCGPGRTGYAADAAASALPALQAALAGGAELQARTAAICVGEMGDYAQALAPQLMDGGHWEILPQVGIGMAEQFERYIYQGAGKGNSGVPRVDAEKVEALGALPPSLVPRLVVLADEAGPLAQYAAGPVPFFEHGSYRWIAAALAGTGSPEAAAFLVRSKAFGYAARMGNVALPLLLALQPSNLDEQVQWIKALDAIGTPAARQAAAQQLERSMPALVAALHDSSWDSSEIIGRRSAFSPPAIKRFIDLGVLARGGSPRVLPLLQHENEAVRAKAAAVLAHMQALEAEPQVVALYRASRTAGRPAGAPGIERGDLTRAYGSALEALHRAPGFIATLPTERLAALAMQPPGYADPALSYIGDTVPELARRRALPELLQLLPTAPDRALAALLGLGEAARPALPQLLQLLDDKRFAYMLGDPGGRYFLGRWGLQSEADTRLLARHVLETASPGGRYYGAEVLAHAGNIPADSQAALRQALQQPALWEYGGGPPATLRFVLTGKRHGDGPLLAPTVLAQELAKQKHCLQNSPAMQPEACTSLRQLDDAGVAAVAPLLAHADPAVRQGASDYLGDVGARARPALPHMAKQLGDPMPLVRRVAADNIARVHGYQAPPPALAEYLAGALQGKDPEEKQAAVMLLSRFRQLPAKSDKALLEALSDPTLQRWRSTLLAALGRTGSQRAAAWLCARLEEAATQAERDDIAAALAGAGPAAGAVLQQYSGKASDPDLLAAYAQAMATHDAARSAALVGALLAQLQGQLALQDTEQASHAAARRRAARRLGVLMRFSRKAGDLAQSALAQQDRHVRAPLISALAHSGGPEAVSMLERLAQVHEEDTGAVRQAIDQIKWRHPDPVQRWQRCIEGDRDRLRAFERCRAGPAEG
ncbi:hypothetical protein [Duganella sp. Root336D2]|uniref:hypothetical protein n=1 Tax=Duganella sp. Root336D2 TaxID=1736518 RepID=UPI0006F266D1|nr:hypothetical protein [Duganella sp. Root336D2]KQV47728.1 hypothetical protein ASD07_12445 [Duganella sp. Root336D2]